MDYVEFFRPVFSYALHLVQTNPNRNRWLMEPDAVRNDLAGLLAAARANGAGCDAVNFEQAWYAVCSWLGEMLVDVPNGRRITEELLPPLDPDGTEFYRRLNCLLTPGGDGIVRPEIVDIIKVYGMCLELDYRGYYARPGFEHQRQAYRRRCRQTVEAMPGPQDLPLTRRMRRPFAKIAAKAAMWLLPVAATLVLYGIYRMLLSDLYVSVVG